MSNEPLQQRTIWGEWETKRTRSSHLQQTQMFSINETFEFGARVRPWLADVGKPTLELICEDVRTPEEIARDLMRESEELTIPMFTNEGLQQSGDTPEQEAVDSEGEQEQPLRPVASEEVTKLSCYLALVNLAHEQVVTLWVDEVYRQRFYNQLPQAILYAQGAGLSNSEISAAMQIGEFQGKQEREAAPHVAAAISGANGTNPAPPPPLNAQPAPRDATAHEGFRARLRREKHPLRTRHPPSKTPDVVPSLWMERDYIQKRLPYLAEGISHLDKDELTSLAESISEALQQSYWSILGITLSHHLDREPGARLA
jgi:hypothetical protein